MNRGIKLAVRSICMGVLGLFAMKIRDHRTGEVIGKAVLIPWRGRILVLGQAGELVPEFLPQERLTYWKQELGFTKHPLPDFPSLLASTPSAPSSAPSNRDENPGLPAHASESQGD